MLNTFEPDQGRPFVGPDLGHNCLQRLSAENTSEKRLKIHPPDKSVYLNCFSYFSTKTYVVIVVGTQKDRINETLLLKTQTYV